MASIYLNISIETECVTHFDGFSRIALTRSFAFSRHKILPNFVEAFILDWLLCYIE